MNLCTHYRMILALHMLMLFLHWLGTNNSALSWCNIILLIPDHLMIGHTFNIFIPNTLLGNSTKIQKIQKLAAASLQEDEGSCGRRKHWLGKFQHRIVVHMTWKNRSGNQNEIFMSPVSPVFHTEATVSIGPKNVLRVGTSNINLLSLNLAHHIPTLVMVLLYCELNELKSEVN